MIRADLWYNLENAVCLGEHAMAADFWAELTEQLGDDPRVVAPSYFSAAWDDEHVDHEHDFRVVSAVDTHAKRNGLPDVEGFNAPAHW